MMAAPDRVDAPTSQKITTPCLCLKSYNQNRKCFQFLIFWFLIVPSYFEDEVVDVEAYALGFSREHQV